MATAVHSLFHTGPTPKGPLAQIRPHAITLHGDERVDPYGWLREKSNPEVLTYLEAENAYAAQCTAHTAGLESQLYFELLGRIKEADLTVPYYDRGWWYYTRTEAGLSYPIFCRRRGSLDASEEVYLDQNIRAAGHGFLDLGGMEVSPDGRFLLFLEDVTAFREYTLHVKDLASGEIIDRIPGVWNGTAWAEDSRTFFYMTADAAKRGNAVWRHTLGGDGADRKIYEEEDVLFHVSLSRSKSGEYLFIASEAFTSSEVRVVPTRSPDTPPRVLAGRRPGIEYSIDHVPGRFLMVTNEGAINFRIVSLPETGTVAEAVDWLPGRDAAFVEGVEVFRQHVVVLEREGGLRRLRVQPLDGGEDHYIAFNEAAYGVFLRHNPDFDSETLRFTISSLTTPAAVYDYDMRTRSRLLRKQQEIPSGHDPAAYQLRRLLIPARDGARVPVSLLLPRDYAIDRSRPLLLYAYGAYGTTTEPTFNSAVLSLVDRGFGYAIAHVRGGQELGRSWYDDGKMEKKLNSFYDFIDVAEALIEQGYAAPDRLIANGGSAGGLLVAAVANMRPDLFRAIVADVPFVDVINTMLDVSLPLTAQEWEQWGNPAIEDEYRYLLRYSPYDNVRPQAYPWMLVTTSLNDSQVMYWEPAKWVARLRATKTNDNPLLLKTNMAGGHSGSSGRYMRLREIAFRYAFMLDAVGTLPPGTP
ncbi:MAG TPA: S9 family peptidase [Gemmatimonadales bacterium]|nr:S9 family peptidase [Gemmatimonadales bacterium]